MIVCSQCKTENPENAKFCEECRAKLEITKQFKICPTCGNKNPFNAKFCFECGKNLTEISKKDSNAEKEDTENPDSEEEPQSEIYWKDKCPVCKSSPLTPGVRKGALGIGNIKTFECENCGAVFDAKGIKYKLSKVSDRNNEIWRKYGNQTLTEDEWTRIVNGGASDVEESKIAQEKRQRNLQEIEAQQKKDISEFLIDLQNGNINISTTNNSPIIPKGGEMISIVMNNISFLEPRAVRQTIGGYGGPSIKVTKGVFFRLGRISARSVSHEELKKIDQGRLVLTNKRLVFIGSKRTINIDLKKLLAIEAYKDGIASQRENKQKTEYFIGTDKNTISFTKEGLRISLPINGVVLKAAIMGNIEKLV